MGRRKSRRKIRLRPKKTLPKIFQCPRCGAVSVRVSVSKAEEEVVVKCTMCGLSSQLEYKDFYHPVDYYARFLDEYEKSMSEAGASLFTDEV